DLLPVVRTLGESAFVDYDHLSPLGAGHVAEALVTNGLLTLPLPAQDVVRAAHLPTDSPEQVMAAGLVASRPAVRPGPAWMAGRYAGAAAVSPLTLALADPSEPVRAEAARALGRLGQAARPAIPALFDALADRRAAVRWAAAQALFALGLRPEDVSP